MTTKKLLLTVGLVAGFSLPWTAGAQSTSAEPTVEVTFVEPENFTDVKDRYSAQKEVAQHYLNTLKEHVQRAAGKRLQPGQRLKVTITDIDMAGDFEPWRSPQLQDVRIIKDIYPPRIDLSYQLLDANGTVVAEGKRELRDLAFNMRTTGLPTSDSLRHEKALLDDWLRRDLRTARTAKK